MSCRMISARRCPTIALVTLATIALSAAAGPLGAQQPRWPSSEPQPRSLLGSPQATSPQATGPLPAAQTASPLPAPQAAGPLSAEQPRWPFTEPQPDSSLGAQQPGWLSAEPQATTPSALPEAASAQAARRVPRLVYTTCDGTFHLVDFEGTAHVELGGKHWLVPLEFEKEDIDHDGWRYWVYRQKRSGWPRYAWGFGMDQIPCQGHAVWLGYKPSANAECVWLTYQWGSRIVPQHTDPIPPIPAPPE